MTVIPRWDRALSVVTIDDAEVESRPDVGSSRKSAIGAAASSIPILTRLRSPPLITDAPVSPTKESLTRNRFKHLSKISTCVCI